MKRRNKSSQKPSIILYMLITLGLFALVLVIGFTCNKVFVWVGLSENQASHVAGMIEGIVAAIAAGLVMFQLRSGDYERKRQTKIEEATFLLEYNQSFIQDPNMTEVEHLLEIYAFPEYKNERKGPMITPENRQKFINYLVYLEGMAPLILNNVLSLEYIDDLMAYRFFLAVNSPELQEDQLANRTFAPYYLGCFKVYRMWYEYRKERSLEIPLEEHSLHSWEYFDEFAPDDITVRPALATDSPSEIARLIMLTDPYIYPAGFGKRGLPALEEMIRDPNTVYGYPNIVLAFSGRKMVGQCVILKKRPYNPINADEYLKIYPSLPESFSHTVRNYFNHLPEYVSGSDELYITCVSVAENARGMGVGSSLFRYLIRTYPESRFKLDVLADNASAISLYEMFGFRKNGEPRPGYAYQEKKPMCYEMIRKKRKP